MEYGVREGRPTSFDAVTYLLNNPDLLDARIGAQGALRHWVASGFKEGRSATGVFGSEQQDHALSSAKPGSGAIGANGDRDWFQIDIAAGKAAHLDLNFQDGRSGSLIVYDQTGRLVATNNGAVVGEGSYYIVVSGAEGGAYQLSANPYANVLPTVGTSGERHADRYGGGGPASGA